MGISDEMKIEQVLRGIAHDAHMQTMGVSTYSPVHMNAAVRFLRDYANLTARIHDLERIAAAVGKPTVLRTLPADVQDIVMEVAAKHIASRYSEVTNSSPCVEKTGESDTTGNLQAYKVDGVHFYLMHETDQVIKDLTARLERAEGALQGLLDCIHETRGPQAYEAVQAAKSALPQK